MLRIYLAGRVDVNWRHEFVKACFGEGASDIYPIDPAEVEKTLYGKLVDKSSGFCPVTLNLSLIDSSHLVIALFWDVGHIPIGTSAEVFYAWQKNKPVISLVPKGLERHPWLAQMSTLILPISFNVGGKPQFADVVPKIRMFVSTFGEKLFGRCLYTGPPPRFD